MKKRFFAVMLSAIMAVTVLVGCGDSVETGGRVETGEDREREENDREKQESGESAENDVEGTLGSFLEEKFGEPEPKEVTVCVKETYYTSVRAHVAGGYEYEYDAAGNQTKETWYNWDGSLIGWSEREYDASGNQTKETRYDRNGSVSGWNEWEYDVAGNLTKETEYDSSLGRIVYEGEYITISID